mmetsp:Transcript_2252/g.7542  ORF Transcript_2252/g.7542 Transcript_2252/m.7542 type:complete len:83 (-) Transcript_2252:1608-1856(-)
MQRGDLARSSLHMIILIAVIVTAFYICPHMCNVQLPEVEVSQPHGKVTKTVVVAVAVHPDPIDGRIENALNRERMLLSNSDG